MSTPVERYRADSAGLLAALVDADTLGRYSATLEAAGGSQAEAGQVAFTRRMLGMVARIGAEGVDGLARDDRAGLDALLTDIFAVATWHRWPLPVARLDPGETDLDRAQRGLLGAEAEPQGAALYVLDEETVALRRWRDDQDIALRDDKHW